MHKLTYVVEDPNGDYGAFYIDGNLIIDFETYEMGPSEVLAFLLSQDLISNIEYAEKHIELAGNIEFPDTI